MLSESTFRNKTTAANMALERFLTRMISLVRLEVFGTFKFLLAKPARELGILMDPLVFFDPAFGRYAFPAIRSFSVGHFTNGDPKPPAMVLKSKFARQAQAGIRLLEVRFS